MGIPPLNKRIWKRRPVIDLQWPHHSLVAEVCRQSEGIRKQVCMSECPAIGQGGVGSNPPVRLWRELAVNGLPAFGRGAGESGHFTARARQAHGRKQATQKQRSHVLLRAQNRSTHGHVVPRSFFLSERGTFTPGGSGRREGALGETLRLRQARRRRATRRSRRRGA
jgi:hypothetical protein